ncbi:MAG: serine/threonine protein kinase [Desulfotignum balticum]|uniref:Serine/threonine protein kinase n=1 Tax=Desulfotignum balticum TaxID=115781 RepID=A0A931D051_9BACT|nr:serine/threonine protein kinase [Desulfotignum balticum]
MSETVKQILDRLYPDGYMGRLGKVYTDTSDFMRITGGDVIVLAGEHYLVLRDEVERSFGVEDPKYWVKRCRHLESGERRILKLVFYETFSLSMGEMKIPCYRSPRKEARILDLVRNDPRFMQGFPAADEAGNNVRVLYVVQGKRLDNWIDDLDVDHLTYFQTHLPGILEKFIVSCQAINDLHRMGEKHVDIRRDHLWVAYESGNYVWIDFDYTFSFHENPFGLDIFGLGGLLLYIVGKGFYSHEEARQLIDRNRKIPAIEPEDFLLVFKNRLANLQKIFPYIPDALNQMLLHFSSGSRVYYETMDEFLQDLTTCLKQVK